MCGIFGIYEPSGVSVTGVAECLKRIKHRGPDDEGILLGRPDGVIPLSSDESDPAVGLPHWRTTAGGEWPLALGHRRLSILDLSVAGHQPMSWDSGRYWITYNGEVYNYLELREELECEGCSFQSDSDTEVILAAYARWGADCLKRFTGMWAFGIWDRQENTLFLARDPFGIKPLYYAVSGKRFAFCSEIRGLLSVPWLDKKVDRQAAYDFLAWGRVENAAGRTLRSAIQEMPPATCGLFPVDQPAAFKPRRYWDIDLNKRSSATFEEAAADIREKFLKSIRLHLRSDVPVGAALSGGIDSSAIVGAMRQTGGSGLELHTFSFIPEDERLSEEKWMQETVAFTGATAHFSRGKPEEWASDMDQLISCQSQPFPTLSIYAQHRVFRLVSEKGIKVTMDGQGPDEMFAGYPYFRRDRAMSLKAEGRYREAWRMASAGSGMSRESLLGQLFMPSFLLPWLRRLFGRHKTPGWLDTSWIRKSGVRTEIERFETGGPDSLRRSLRYALLESGIPALLRYEDRNSMHYSVESRVPFLTTELAEAALALPESFHLAPDGTTKHVLRHAFRGLVPDSVLNRRDKVGFAAPESTWMRNHAPWVRDIVQPSRLEPFGLFNVHLLTQLSDSVLNGSAPYGEWLWRVVNFVRWAELSEVSGVL